MLCASVSQFKCCGSDSSLDWADSIWILTSQNAMMVPDSCCKTPRELCGQRDHPSNIYKLEVSFPTQPNDYYGINIVSSSFVLTPCRYSGRLHRSVGGIHSESAAYPRCSGNRHCLSSGKTCCDDKQCHWLPLCAV